MMRQLTVFNNISLDSYFTDESSRLGWVHQRPATLSGLCWWYQLS